MSEFNKRVDKSVAYLEEHFNHKPETEQVSREELREVLITALNFIKEDFKTIKP